MIAIINYNAGNIASVQNALSTLNIPFCISNTAEELCDEKITHIIFPGVGHADHAMKELKKTDLIPTIINTKKPFLGICLGMQILGKHSEEGNTESLNIFDFPVKKFQSDKEPIPHMGWNSISWEKDSPLFKNIDKNTDFYFVHSYYVPLLSTSVEHSIAECNYIQPFSAAIQKDNFFAVQFHPEKSGQQGLHVLKNFYNYI